MKRGPIAVLAAVLVTSTAAFASLGGWAVVSVRRFRRLVVGKPLQLQWQVRQHGSRRYRPLPTLEARSGRVALPERRGPSRRMAREATEGRSPSRSRRLAGHHRERIRSKQGGAHPLAGGRLDQADSRDGRGAPRDDRDLAFFPSRSGDAVCSRDGMRRVSRPQCRPDQGRGERFRAESLHPEVCRRLLARFLGTPRSAIDQRQANA